MMDVEDPVQCYLDNTLQINRQLHESLRRKQEEISALEERNAELKELLRQADHYTALLDELRLHSPDHAPCPGLSPRPNSPGWLESLLLETPPGEEPQGSEQHPRARRRLWPSLHGDDPPRPFTESPTKRPRLDRDLGPSQGPHPARVFGSFRGLQVVEASAPSTPGENVRFRTAVREHGTVRTRAFPHGRTLTSLAPDGACRFLWVPEHD